MATPDDIARYREFLKDSIRQRIDFRGTDQSRGLAAPPVQKPLPPNTPLLALPPPSGHDGICRVGLLQALRARRSHRHFQDTPLSFAELGFLLWATQGVRSVRGSQTTLRTVPSAGARHAFETYVVCRAVRDAEPGLYRYAPLQHALVPLRADRGLSTDLCAACFSQDFVAEAAATFVWTVIPYRMEWRYDLAAHRVLAIDVGHVCQNLYLACEAVAAGTCAVGAYDQAAVDELLGVDGQDEFTLYLAPVGKVLAATEA
jgi:SagB-type dehydrogenase family enzyme